MKHLLIIVFSLLAIGANCQLVEKQMYAKSFVDQKAPEFHVTKWLTEEPAKEGKFVLIDFWATWCSPCRKAIPELNSFSEKYKNDLVVIGISAEKEEVIKKMHTPKINYYSAIDSTRQMERILEIKGIPHVLLIDPDGIVRWQGFPLLPGYELTDSVVNAIIVKYRKK